MSLVEKQRSKADGAAEEGEEPEEESNGLSGDS